MTLKGQLAAAGSDMDPAEFRDLVQEVRAALFPVWTAEELLHHPREALCYCRAVRSRVGAKISDSVILHALTNTRKHRAYEASQEVPGT